MEENIRESNSFYLDFDWLKDVGKNLMPEIEFTIKSKEPLAS